MKHNKFVFVYLERSYLWLATYQARHLDVATKDIFPEFRQYLIRNIKTYVEMTLKHVKVRNEGDFACKYQVYLH